MEKRTVFLVIFHHSKKMDKVRGGFLWQKELIDICFLNRFFLPAEAKFSPRCWKARLKTKD
ncbi:hypothetical protein [Angelakisella massiliensis]|uniref:hypothetical protein n=1 Tax=Angelakisella massiliensis TaxID=1871018 RepID=UPI0008F922C8|nr:hypothetical protein [Angelakisella massiliensis]